jgi:hypothetical protein
MPKKNVARFFLCSMRLHAIASTPMHSPVDFMRNWKNHVKVTGLSCTPMVLAKHDTEANIQLLLAMDSEAPKKQPTKRKRQPPKRVPARAPKAAATPASADDSSSNDDITFAEHMRNASKFGKKPRLRSNRKIE